MKHVLIIGAGFAGVSAAVHCVEAGHRVTLLEASDRLGGRASSFVDRESGELLDNGQHLCIGAYHATLRLLTALGTADKLIPQKRFGVAFVHPGGVRTTLAASPFFSGAAGLLAGILTTNHLTWTERMALIRGMRGIQRLDARTVPERTISQLLDRFQQPHSLQQKFWTPFVLAVMNNTSERAAGTLLVEVVRRAFFTGSENARLLLPSVGLSTLLDPVDALLEKHGSSVRRKSVATGLIMEVDRAAGAQLQSGERVYADAIITAIPPYRVVDLLAPDIMRLPGFPILEFEYSPIVTCYCRLDRSVMDEVFLGSTTTAVQWIFNRSKMIGGPNSGQLLAMVISAMPLLSEMPIDQLQERFLADLHALLPESRSATMNWMKIIKEKRATFVCTPTAEGIRSGPETPVPNLFIAGDWTKTGLPATIESAAVSGERAARAATRSLQTNV